jgi:predicted transcriptional regulator
MSLAKEQTEPIKLVRDLMHIGVTTCSIDTPLPEAVRILLQEGLESLIALDSNGHAAGRLTRPAAMAAYGRLAARANGYETLTVEDVMHPNIPEIPADIPVTAAVQLMLDWNEREAYLMHHDGGISWPAARLGIEEILRYLVTQSETDTVFNNQ